jgi:hypothetical protein
LVQGLLRGRTEAPDQSGETEEIVSQGILGESGDPTLEDSGGLHESLNAGIQRLKKRACGYRSREKFRIAILFNFGGLDLMPEGAKWD